MTRRVVSVTALLAALALPSSTLVFGVRRGRVRYVAVADRRIAGRSALRRYIRFARLR